MKNGFRFGNLYGSYNTDEGRNSIGIEIGIIDVPNYDDSVIAHTVSIAISLSHFIFALGLVLQENEMN